MQSHYRRTGYHIEQAGLSGLLCSALLVEGAVPLVSTTDTRVPKVAEYG